MRISPLVGLGVILTFLAQVHASEDRLPETYFGDSVNDLPAKPYLEPLLLKRFDEPVIRMQPNGEVYRWVCRNSHKDYFVATIILEGTSGTFRVGEVFKNPRRNKSHFNQKLRDEELESKIASGDSRFHCSKGIVSADRAARLRQEFPFTHLEDASWLKGKPKHYRSGVLKLAQDTIEFSETFEVAKDGHYSFIFNQGGNNGILEKLRSAFFLAIPELQSFSYDDIGASTDVQDNSERMILDQRVLRDTPKFLL